MLIFKDDGSVQYISAHNIHVTIVPVDVLTQAERDAIRPVIAKLQQAARGLVRAALTAAANEIP